MRTLINKRLSAGAAGAAASYVAMPLAMAAIFAVVVLWIRRENR